MKHDEAIDINGEEEVIYEEDHGTDAIKKLREKLKKCEEEKKENLDGWQRAQADLVNARAKHNKALADMQERAIEAVFQDIIGALDSFDLAFQGEAWEHVDEVWRKGVEHIHAQLLNTLTQHGVEAYGEVGDQFDPQLHEALESAQTPDGDKSDKIARVQRRGYKRNDRIIRPAQVVVYE